MKGSRWWRWIARAFLAWLAYVALVSLVLHPYWAVTRATGSRTLVVEGWMHQQGLEEAAALYRDGGYERMLVTGAARPFAYYLRPGDTLEAAWEGLHEGALEIGIAGLPGEPWSFLDDDGLLLQGTAREGVARHSVQLRPTRTIRIAAAGADRPAQDPVLFVAGAWLNGRNVHGEGTIVAVRRNDGRTVMGTPTYAHLGAQALERLGVPPAAITVLPTWSIERSKTFSAARDADAWARAHRIATYDVATLGVHARRTWKMHRIARQGAPVGNIALNDPWCRRWSWWGNYYGWFQVLKETIALPAPWLVDHLGSEEADSPSAPAPR